MTSKLTKLSTDLYKRSRFFEKLAVFSDPKTFLKRLAQAGDNTGSLKMLVEKASELLQGAGVSPLNLTMAAKDPATLAQIIEKATLNMDPVEKSGPIQQLKHLATLIRSQGWSTPSSAASSTPISTKPGLTFSSAVQKLQHMLNAINKFEGFSIPIKEDGLLGAETRKVVEAYKKYFGLPENLALNQVMDSMEEKIESHQSKYVMDAPSSLA